MAGKKGRSGRPNGSVGTRSQTLAEILNNKGCFPELVLSEIAADPNADPDARRDAAKALMPYRWPRLSAMEVKAEIDITKPLVIINGPTK